MNGVVRKERTPMKSFLINAENNVTVYASLADAHAAVTPGSIVFSTRDELTQETAPWPTARFVPIWNSIPGVVAVKKFTDRKTALQRIWIAIQILEPAPPPLAAQPAAPRPATKKATVLAMLTRPDGATVPEIVTALGWQPHSVRGFLSLLKKNGNGLSSFKRASGERAYARQSQEAK
jgi:uncharacterized protein DUF3489